MKELFILIFQKISMLLVISFLFISYGLSRYKKRVNQSKLIGTIDTYDRLPKNDPTEINSSRKANREITVLSKYGPMAGRMIRIGLAGAFIECAQPLKMDEHCMVKLLSINDTRGLSIESRVLWNNTYLRGRHHIRIGMSVQFLNLDQQKRLFLIRLMEAI